MGLIPTSGEELFTLSNESIALASLCRRDAVAIHHNALKKWHFKDLNKVLVYEKDIQCMLQETTLGKVPCVLCCVHYAVLSVKCVVCNL